MTKKTYELSTNLNITLQKIRQLRQFKPIEYIQAKSYLLNQYLIKSNLNSCVISLTGGIDSSVALGLIHHASCQKNSPIKKIVALIFPLYDEQYASYQKKSVEKTVQLCKKLSIELKIIDITKAHKQIYENVENSNLKSLNVSDESRAQLFYYTKTPHIYYSTTILKSEGFNSLVIGSINRDEGSYLGYLGKSSTGMVDLQLISDLHKSEIFSIAKELKIPSNILKSKNITTRYNKKTDDEMFGFSYDFIELYLNYKSTSLLNQNNLTQNWSQQDFDEFSIYSQNVEKIHNRNAHKYSVGSPAIHLDIYQSGIDNGWIDGIHSTPHKDTIQHPINHQNFIGLISPQPELESFMLEADCIKTTIHKPYNTKDTSILEFNSLLSILEINHLRQWIIQNNHMAQKINYAENTNNENVSEKIKFYCENFAKTLFERIKFTEQIAPFLIVDNNTENHFSNYKNIKVWKLVGLNPMFSISTYPTDSFVSPKYDDEFIQTKVKRGLKTLLIGIETADGGSIDFIKDTQIYQPYSDRFFGHTKYNSFDSIHINKSFHLQPGQAIIYDNKLLHQGEKVNAGEKIILKTELMYESCEFEKH